MVGHVSGMQKAPGSFSGRHMQPKMCDLNTLMAYDPGILCFGSYPNRQVYPHKTKHKHTSTLTIILEFKTWNHLIPG